LFLVDNENEIWTTAQINIALGCYALYLATGHTIYCKSIKAATIEEYLKAAAGLIKKLDPVDGRDAMYDRDGVKYIGITSVLREVRRIEKVPNRRENYSIAMHFRLYERQKIGG